METKSRRKVGQLGLGGVVFVDSPVLILIIHHDKFTITITDKKSRATTALSLIILTMIKQRISLKVIQILNSDTTNKRSEYQTCN